MKCSGVGDGDDVGVGFTAADEDTRNDDTVDDRPDEAGIGKNDLSDEIFDDGDNANIAAVDTTNNEGLSKKYLVPTKLFSIKKRHQRPAGMQGFTLK